MARVRPVSEIQVGDEERAAYKAAERRYGSVPEPMTIWAHSPAVLRGVIALERAAAVTWKAVDPELVELAVLRSAQIIGCEWCVDFGTYLVREGGTNAEKLAELPHWRSSNVFGPKDRLVLEYAEAMSATPPRVTDEDELVERLRDEFAEHQVVELTMFLALENMRSRFNNAMGLTSQGYAVGLPSSPGNPDHG